MNPISLNLNKVNYNSLNHKPVTICNASNPQNNSLVTFSGVIAKQEIENSLNERRFFNEFLSRPSKLTKEEYEDIKQNHPSILAMARNYVKRNFKSEFAPEELAIIVDKVDKYLKNNYKNYKIISLGTSPAALCEQLSALGHDIIYVPVSGLQNYITGEYTLDELPNLKTVLDYVKSKNTDDNKNTIILDYVSSGKTLNTMGSLISQYCNIPREKICKLSLGNLLTESFKDVSFFDKAPKSSFSEAVGFCEVDQISNVPHFSVTPEADREYENKEYTIKAEDKTKEELFREFENYSSPLARAFSLCAMQEYNLLNK